jgi:polysaccharide export outer membrane protein
MRQAMSMTRPHWAAWSWLGLGLGLVALLAAAPLHAQTATSFEGAPGQPMSSLQTRVEPPGAQQVPVKASPEMGSPSAAVAVPGAGSLSADYRIASNDLMEFDVFGVPDMKRDVRVNASGDVSLPLIGPVRVAGLTVHAAQTLIAQRYEEKYLLAPQVSLFVKEFTTQRIAIEGAVIRPGIYPVMGELTLLRALALSGGFAQYADINQIMVYRSGSGGANGTAREQFTYDLDKVRSGQVMDPAIRSDDVIVVQRNPKRAALRDSLFSDILSTLNPFK